MALGIKYKRGSGEEDIQISWQYGNLFKDLFVRKNV